MIHPEAASDLISRVEQFSFDRGDPQLPFAARLARENGWSHRYTERVLREYKRFAILAVTAGHPVSPSEEVDQAWHLHLTYTRSYWDHFCQEVLETPLHHDPTTGGTAEREKYFSLYSQTLASYARIFAEQPPADIWPDPATRFRTAGKSRWIDASRYWIIPRLNFFRLPAFLSMLCILTLLGCGAAEFAEFEELSPFRLGGPDFLSFYLCLLIVAGIFSMLVHWFYPWNPAEVSVEEIAREPYLAVGLANGPRGVLVAALARLIHGYHLHIQESPSTGRWFASKPPARVFRGEPLAPDSPEVEQALYLAAGEEGEIPLKKMIQAASPAAKRSCERLRDMELSDSEEEGWLPRWIPLIFMRLVLLLGITRLIIGIFRGKPVGLLIVLILLGTVFSLIMHFQRRKRSPLGEKTRRTLLKQFKLLKSRFKDRSAITPTDVILAAGLFGITDNLQDPRLQALCETMRKEEIFRQADTGISSYSAGCGSGCGGGGCGGGCGGCGGD